MTSSSIGVAMRGVECKISIVVLLVFGVLATVSYCATVTYDQRALVIDGKRRVLISGSIHYPRSTPEMWPDLIKKAKEGGLDVIDTCVFWSLHEPVRGKYNFEGLVGFVKAVAKEGLYVSLRIGPYVSAEWNYGGFPLWLRSVPNIFFRTDNEPFKAEMQKFTAKIVEVLKNEKLFAPLGGPIIFSQIEHEYGEVELAYGGAGGAYINWAAKMAVSMNTGVPWVMSLQPNATPPVICTCNGFSCEYFTPMSKNVPKMWTQNWSGWYLQYGAAVPKRLTRDLAFPVARFYQRGGTFHNYYMYHGGTNFGRSSGGLFLATSFDFDAPIDEYGLLRQPKYGHLKDLHKAIKLCEPAMVGTDPKISKLGKNCEAAEYKTGSTCSAFLANFDTESEATVTFNGISYKLPAWSVSILPDCKNVVFNTAKINTAKMIPSFKHQLISTDVESTAAVGSGWSWIKEPVGISKGDATDAVTKKGLLEQIITTADKSDYLWYSISVNVNEGNKANLYVKSLGHALHAFVNGKLSGSGTGTAASVMVDVEIPVEFASGKNNIDLLSLTVGLRSSGAMFDMEGAGITGPVQLKGFKNGTTIDLSPEQWTYQIGLKGEDQNLPSGGSQWDTKPTFPKNQPLTWYKTQFDAPGGSNPVALDFTGMGKGEAWVNGQSIGRYWPTNIATEQGCTENCDYRGDYMHYKCRKNCGKPSQTLYHVPRSWLKPKGNTLVLFEEVGGDPTRLSLATRQVQSLCSRVSESHPSPVDLWSSDLRAGRKSLPRLSLECAFPNQVISSIKFASYGRPIGTCGSFSHGSCNSTNALSIVQNMCVGSKSCSIEVSSDTFGKPCKGVTKSLAVEASCT